MKKEYELTALEYAYDSLEPFIDEQTMKIHHDKHHKTYSDKLIETLQSNEQAKSLLNEKTPEKLLIKPTLVPEEIRQKVINFGGGHVNHSFFWTIMKKNTAPNAEMSIIQEINKKFNSFEKFKELFSKEASVLFGSGWTWLAMDNKTKEIEILNLKNQDSPLTLNKIPLLCIDLWEHSYYLKYQNKRADYIEAFFNVINWEKVNDYFRQAKQNKK
jgi:Fe-Mn family superoxide dismutase